MEYKKAVLAKELIEIKERNDKIISKLKDRTVEIVFKTIDSENMRCVQKSFTNDGSKLIEELKDTAINFYKKHNKELDNEIYQL